MNKFLTGYLVGASLFLAGGIMIDRKHVGEYQRQIQQRDSVNTINIERNKQLEEYIRLDSLTLLEQLK